MSSILNNATKWCRKCESTKPLTEFGINTSRKDGRTSACKACRRQYQNHWYSENKHLHRERVKANYQRAINKTRKYVWDYLLIHPCVDCGEPDPVVLEFDHRGDKEFNIGSALVTAISVDRLAAEVAKCDVRCANCHRRKSSESLGWWKSNHLTL